jgi:hypothetical protein
MPDRWASVVGGGCAGARKFAIWHRLWPACLVDCFAAIDEPLDNPAIGQMATGPRMPRLGGRGRPKTYRRRAIFREPPQHVTR